MLQTYSQVAPGLTPENRSVALKKVADVLNSSRYNFTKMPPEDEFSELGLRENLKTFQVLVSNPARENRRAKDLGEKLQKANTAKSDLSRKLQQSYTEKSEINRKLQITCGEKMARDDQIRKLKAQLSTLKKENASLKKKNKAQEKKLNKLRRSVSFRIGRALTWPVRKARALVKRHHRVTSG